MHSLSNLHVDRGCIRSKEELMNLPFLSLKTHTMIGTNFGSGLPSQMEHPSKKTRIIRRFLHVVVFALKQVKC